MKPQFPLTIFFEEEGEKCILEDEKDAACNLEWFDSDDPEEHAVVKDNQNRLVRLKVKELDVLVCELEE